jgi:ABC-type sugar transport system permease subunit
LSGGLLYLNRGPKEALKWVFLVASLVVLAYPGLALAVNLNRLLWNALMVALFPITALALGLGLAILFKQAWARLPFQSFLGLALFLAALYPFSLSAEARAHFLEEGGIAYGLLLALGLGAFFGKGFAPWLGLLSAAGLRALLVMVGQWQGLGL